MKTPEEIRRHRDDIERAIRLPCGCAGTEHEEKCIRGMWMMRASVGVLNWVLGEDEGYQSMVDTMAREVRR